MDIDGKRPVVEISGRSFVGKETRLIKTMPQKHGLLKAAIPGDLLIIEQGAYVV